ncbi:MAG: hypothetical protein R3E89_01715 [Thiolinea sp.]
MDLPGEMEINWYTLVKLFNADELFFQKYNRASEANVMSFPDCGSGQSRLTAQHLLVCT